MYGSNDGTFSNSRRLFAGRYRSESYIHDLNDDGILDVIIANNDAVRYYLGTGDANQPYQGRVDFNNLDICWGMAMGDFNLDGRTDLIVSEQNDDLAYLYAGNATSRPLSDTTASGFFQALGRGNLRDADDVDWYAFSAKQGESLALVTENANIGDVA